MKSNLPLVSVISVVLNAKNTIERCIRSVIEQSYVNVELIVVDGVSSDGTVDILLQLRESIDVLIIEADKGIYDAMNKGIMRSNGKYILLLNSDDWYDSNAVHILMSAAITFKADIVHANAFKVNKKGDIIGLRKGGLNEKLFTKGMPICHETMLVKREVYMEHGVYDSGYSIIGDYEFIVRIFGGNLNVVHVDKYILYFCMHGISNTDHEKRIAERSKLFNSLFPFLGARDLEVLSKGATVKQRREMLELYAGKSQVFDSSMKANIFAESDARLTTWSNRYIKAASSVFWLFVYRLFYKLNNMTN